MDSTFEVTSLAAAIVLPGCFSVSLIMGVVLSWYTTKK
jgi:hypothetical protein